MAESGARRHHFISQCYLKRFTTNGSKKSQLFVVGLEQKATFSTRPDNVAHRRDFNRMEGRPPGELEQALAAFEAQAADALRKIDEVQSIEDVDAWLHVLNLIALFAVRHPIQREQFRKVMQHTARVIGSMTVATRERYANQVRRATEAGFLRPGVAVPYEKMRDFVERNEYTVSVPTGRHLLMELKMHQVVLESLVDRRWLLVRAADGTGDFVTSDCPVALTNSDGAPPSHHRPLGHKTRGTSLLFPLTRRLFAIGTFEGPSGIFFANQSQVAALNTSTLQHAYREVYASSSKAAFELGGKLVTAADVLSTADDLRRM